MTNGRYDNIMELRSVLGMKSERIDMMYQFALLQANNNNLRIFRGLISLAAILILLFLSNTIPMTRNNTLIACGVYTLCWVWYFETRSKIFKNIETVHMSIKYQIAQGHFELLNGLDQITPDAKKTFFETQILPLVGLGVQKTPEE